MANEDGKEDEEKVLKMCLPMKKRKRKEKSEMRVRNVKRDDWRKTNIFASFLSIFNFHSLKRR
jgi:hypothetical protein